MTTFVLADEKKVKEIFNMVEAVITEELNLWDDTGFVKELDQRMAEYKGGKVKGSTWAEVKAKAKASKLR